MSKFDYSMLCGKISELAERMGCRTGVGLVGRVAYS